MNQLAIHNVVSVTAKRSFYDSFNTLEYVATDESGNKTTFMLYCHDKPVQVASLPDESHIKETA
jgi:hypothetical protein